MDTDHALYQFLLEAHSFLALAQSFYEHGGLHNR